MEKTAQWVDINELVPWDKNPRDNDKAVAEVAKSIQRFGWGAPIIARRTDGVIIAGHTRHKAAQQLGMDKVLVRFMDLDPAQAAALALADNKLNEIATWDEAQLYNILKELQADGVQLDGLGWDDDAITNIIAEGEHSGQAQEKYTAKVTTPLYEPTGDRPELHDLFDQTKTKQLLQAIEVADIAEDIKAFLIAAAHRHTVLRFDRIAEYYCHATADLQRLMEQSALVIIDWNQAVEQGFVKLTEEMHRLVQLEEGMQDVG
jgi:hypothetical protein